MDKIKQQAKELTEDIFYEIENTEIDKLDIMYRLAEAVGLIEEMANKLEGGKNE